VTLRLMGRFWHPRGMVLARVAHYLQTRIPVRPRCAGLRAAVARVCVRPGKNTAATAPTSVWRSRSLRLAFACALLAQEIAEVVIEDEKQLDDSAENF
jgi:hypothetical protein